MVDGKNFFCRKQESFAGKDRQTGMEEVGRKRKKRGNYERELAGEGKATEKGNKGEEVRGNK
jgi:hypothetical protein